MRMSNDKRRTIWQNDSNTRFVDDISDENEPTGKQASCLKVYFLSCSKLQCSQSLAEKGLGMKDKESGQSAQRKKYDIISHQLVNPNQSNFEDSHIKNALEPKTNYVCLLT